MEVRRNQASVAIASAITAYARLAIYKYKNIPDNPCHYTDTDSVVLSRELAQCHVGEGLGEMKLEYRIAEGYFIRPKLYYIKTTDGKTIFKCKGIKAAQINEEAYHKLFRGSPFDVEVERFYKDNDRTHTGRGVIVKKVKMRLSPPCSDKRQLIYNNKGIWVDTKPLVLNAPIDVGYELVSRGEPVESGVGTTTQVGSIYKRDPNTLRKERMRRRILRMERLIAKYMKMYNKM